jgi:hypothetical protein
MLIIEHMTENLESTQEITQTTGDFSQLSLEQKEKSQLPEKLYSKNQNHSTTHLLVASNMKQQHH